MPDETMIEKIAPLTVDRFEIASAGPRTVVLKGELALRDPVAELGPHLRRIHDAAAGGGELVIDVRPLAYVNSSGLRIFLDWVAWISAEPAERRYRLAFQLAKKSTWQAAAFPAIAMLGGDAVRTETL